MIEHSPKILVSEGKPLPPPHYTEAVVVGFLYTELCARVCIVRGMSVRCGLPNWHIKKELITS